jgi:hypothetical protein
MFIDNLVEIAGFGPQSDPVKRGLAPDGTTRPDASLSLGTGN